MRRGVVTPDEGSFSLVTSDGSVYRNIGPGSTGYEPALGYDKPFGSGNAPLTPGQQVVGYVGIDSPHVAGTVYLVGNVDTLTTGTLPNYQLEHAVGGWSLAG